LVHSAAWDPDYSFKEKTVAIIGSGSSAIQMVPIIQKGVYQYFLKIFKVAPLIDIHLPETKSLISFNRSPTWISSEFLAEVIPEGRDAVFSEEQKAHWINNPIEFLKFRKEVEHSVNELFNLQFKNTPLQDELHQQCRERMEKELKRKKELTSILIPSFAVGCRR
jgi:hypothetical protein